MIGFGTFVQQALQVEVHEDQIALKNITAPRATVATHTTVPSLNAEYWNLDLKTYNPLKLAIYTGLFQQNLTPLNISCPSKRCEWSNIFTLGMCSECTDISGNLIVDQNGTITLQDGQRSIGNYSFNRNEYPLATFPGSQGSIDSELNYSPVHYNYSDSSNGTHHLYIFDIFDTRTETSDINNSIITTTYAHECAISACIHAYSQHVINGVPEHFWYNANDNTDLSWDRCDQTDIQNETCNPLTTASSGYYRLQVFAGSSVPTVFAIDDDTIAAIRSALSTTFNGTRKKEPGHDLFDILVNSAPSNISNIVANVALSLSNMIRSNPGNDSVFPINKWYWEAHSILEGSARFDGVAYYDRTFLKVVWAWLIFPIAVVVAAVLFMILTIVRTKQMRLRAYKYDALAVMSRKMPEGLREEIREGLNTKGMRRRAKRVNVRLENDEKMGGKDWRFVR
jgi:hypothetical protein